ncbi:hypothetical protein BC833DRAFT_622588 [Globomyces pollinis-pini]|nr:hypothetical protein BC833DRAFT_622588 [Globomyces pollinis-pini]
MSPWIVTSCFGCSKTHIIAKQLLNSNDFIWICKECETRNKYSQTDWISYAEEHSCTYPDYCTVCVDNANRIKDLHTSKIMNDSIASAFCNCCQHNQERVILLMSNGTPNSFTDESYKAHLLQRYPIVCSQCMANVERKLKLVNNTFKANMFLDRLIESKQRAFTIQSPYQIQINVLYKHFKQSWTLLNATCIFLQKTLIFLFHLMGIFYSKEFHYQSKEKSSVYLVRNWDYLMMLFPISILISWIDELIFSKQCNLSSFIELVEDSIWGFGAFTILKLEQELIPLWGFHCIFLIIQLCLLTKNTSWIYSNNPSKLVNQEHDEVTDFSKSLNLS